MSTPCCNHDTPHTQIHQDDADISAQPFNAILPQARQPEHLKCLILEKSRPLTSRNMNTRKFSLQLTLRSLGFRL